MATNEVKPSFSDADTITTNDLVNFEDVEDRYEQGHDIFVVYTLGKDISPHAKDWVGLLKTGWTDTKDYIAFEWAAERPIDDKFPLKRTVCFLSQKTKHIQNSLDYYQFLYINKDGNVLGVSKCFHISEDASINDIEIIERPVEKDILDSFELVKNDIKDPQQILPAQPIKKTFDPISLVSDFSSMKKSKQEWEDIVAEEIHESKNSEVAPYIPIYSVSRPKPVTPDHEWHTFTGWSSELPFAYHSLPCEEDKSDRSQAVSQPSDSFECDTCTCSSFAVRGHVTSIVHSCNFTRPTLKDMAPRSSVCSKVPATKSQQAMRKDLRTKLKKIKRRECGQPTTSKRFCAECKKLAATEKTLLDGKEHLEKEITELTKNYDQLDEILASKNVLVSELAERVKKLIHENCLLSATVDNFKNTTDENNNVRIVSKQLSSRLDELMAEKLKLEAAKEQMTEKIADLRIEKRTMLRKNVQLQQEVNSLNETYQTLDKQMDDIMFTLSAKGFTTMVDRKGSVIDLQGKKGSMVDIQGWDIVRTKKSERQLDKLASRVRTHEATITQLTEENNTLMEENKKLKAENTDLQDTIGTVSSNKSIKQNVNTFTVEIIDLKASMEKLKCENNKLHDMLLETEQGMSRIAEQNQELEKLKNENSRLQRIVLEHQVDVPLLRQELQEKTKRLKEKNIKLELKTHKLVERTKKLKQVKTELAESQTLVNELEEKEKAFHKQKTDLMQAQKHAKLAQQNVSTQSTVQSTTCQSTDSKHHNLLPNAPNLLAEAHEVYQTGELVKMRIHNIFEAEPKAVSNPSSSLSCLIGLSDIGYPKVILSTTLCKDPKQEKSKPEVSAKRLKYSDVVKGVKTLPESDSDSSSSLSEKIVADKPLLSWPKLDEKYDNSKPSKNMTLPTPKLNSSVPVQTSTPQSYCCNNASKHNPQTCPHCLLLFPPTMDSATVQKHIERHEQLGS